MSFGAWAIGGFWGAVDDDESMRALHAAVDAGVNFVDTADVYGDGRSERLVARLRRERPGETIHVATKAGRRLAEQTVEGYSRANLTAWIDDSLRNLETDRLDLLQLHCPPIGVYARDEVFAALDDLVASGKVAHYGTSVETVAEAQAALARPGIATVQIIFNMFRPRPAEVLFDQVQAASVGILARVPLASGLLTGRITAGTEFAPDDHRHFNRHGERFDVGETFSGVPLDAALPAVDALRPLVPAGATLAQLALRWILMFDAVSCTIPGARTPRQARENAAAADLPPLTPQAMQAVATAYDAHVRAHVHDRW